MKRIFLLWFAVLLLLGGCALRQEQPFPSTAPQESLSATEATSKPGGGDRSAESNEPLQTYPLDDSDCLGFLCMGEDILLFTGFDSTNLTKLCGADLSVSAAAQLECSVFPYDPAVRASEQGLTYYDGDRNLLVFLDPQLKEVKQISLPDSILGAPALSTDCLSLYYCTDEALRCIDLESGLDRLMKELHFSELTLTALHCDNTVICCAAVDDGGNQSFLYICTETGRLLNEIIDDTSVWTAGDLYFATHWDGAYQELLIGDSEQGPTLLQPHTYGSTVYPVVEIGGAVLATADEVSNSLLLDYYDLRSGRRTAQITLEGCDTPFNLCAAADQHSVWFLRPDADSSAVDLCRWDLGKSATGETISHFSARYSFERPDEEGLASCRRMAQTLSDKYGVQILLWRDAVAFQPWDYTLVPEYQVRVIQEELQMLDSVLALYPEGFLQKAAEGTTSGRIQICLVRSIFGNESADGTLNEVVGLQYWSDESGTYDAYLSLSAGQNALMRNTCHEIFHIIESRVMTACKAYDDWDQLNPAGFEYDYNYVTNLERQDYQWVEGDSRAFIDLYSMSFPKEDRARIMEYAMMPDNGAFFETDTMQRKLRQLCIGIREAFGMKKTDTAFTWEQYLNNPLHYG